MASSLRVRTSRLAARATASRVLLAVCVSCSVLLSGVGAGRVSAEAGEGASWAALGDVLLPFVQQGVFPGAVLALGSAHATARGETGGVLAVHAVGHLAYPGDVLPLSSAGAASHGSSSSSGDQGADVPEMRADTRFDVASLTKVTATTTATALLVQDGLLALDDAVASEALLGGDFAQAGKAAVTVRHLLLHNAGFPPDPSPNYWQPEFDCSATSQPLPPQDFSCLPKIWSGLMAQTLSSAPGQQYRYSDLSMITLALVVGRVVHTNQLVQPADLRADCHYAAQGAASGGMPPPALLMCAYEAFVRINVIEAAGMVDSGFLPSPAYWGRIAPTWIDDHYRHLEPLQGVVSDGNSYAMGGIAGHAGLFATAHDLARLVTGILRSAMVAPGYDATRDAGAALLTPDIARLFTTVADAAQSRRALGWDTNSSLCGSLSPRTFTHTGYTGTQICADPQRGLVTVLLTNRAYPQQTANFAGVAAARRAFNDAAMRAFDACLEECGGVCPCAADGGSGSDAGSGSGSAPRDNGNDDDNDGGNDGGERTWRLAALVLIVVIVVAVVGVAARDRCVRSAQRRRGSAAYRGLEAFRPLGFRAGRESDLDGSDAR